MIRNMKLTARRAAFAALLPLVCLISACATASAERGGMERLYASPEPAVTPGLEVAAADGFPMLAGKRIGLIANHSSIDTKGRHSIDLLYNDPNVDLVALFSPEHGIRGEADTKVGDETDDRTGLPIYSLYGETRKPTPEMLEGVDVLIFDIQDIGARFYTYISTMAMAMEAAQENGIEFVVFDRPNPIRGDWFDGPVQDEDLTGRFTAFVLMPVVHGMTVGEIAHLFHEHHDIGDEPNVVKMEGWTRDMYFDETGLPWVNPSPNMRSVDQELLYTMVALTEANKIVSVGRGTESPFEFLGAPWMDGEAITMEMRSRNLPGIWFMETTFVPRAMDVSGRENYPYQYTEEINHGFRVVVTDRHKVSPVEAGIHMLDALLELYPEKYSVDNLRGLVGAQWVLDDLNARKDPQSIVEKWRTSPEFQAFAERRESVLLY